MDKKKAIVIGLIAGACFLSLACCGTFGALAWWHLPASKTNAVRTSNGQSTRTNSTSNSSAKAKQKFDDIDEDDRPKKKKPNF